MYMSKKCFAMLCTSFRVFRIARKKLYSSKTKNYPSVSVGPSNNIKTKTPSIRLSKKNTSENLKPRSSCLFSPLETNNQNIMFLFFFQGSLWRPEQRRATASWPPWTAKNPKMDVITVPYNTIFCSDILLHRPYIHIHIYIYIYGRYLQFRFLKWPLKWYSKKGGKPKL